MTFSSAAVFFAGLVAGSRAQGTTSAVPEWLVPSIPTSRLPTPRLGASAFYNGSGVIITGGATNAGGPMVAPSYFKTSASELPPSL
jgi:hypothetical protein